MNLWQVVTVVYRANTHRGVLGINQLYLSTNSYHSGMYANLAILRGRFVLMCAKSLHTRL